MNTFNQFNLPEFIVKSLGDMQITAPTPVQVLAIPPALEGKNILASAQTGTGKTIAYLVPIVAKLSTLSEDKAIILCPTRELAMQVQDAARRLIGRSGTMNVALLIGGEPMPKQMAQLRRNPRIIVGTPGRTNDILNRSLLRLEKCTFLVLDEVDRMLDMGFAEQLDDIVKHIPKERQTLMFSATLPTNIERLANKYLDNPHRVSVGTENQPVAKIKQDVIYSSNSEKMSHLSKELEAREGSIIIFVKTKHKADQLADSLQDNNHDARAIHGGLRQQKRERVIKDFRDRKNRIIVATDIAARGLDVPHIEHVINFDLPQCPEDYLHRIGRTGRAGAEGSALSLISPDEEHKWRAISRLISDNKFESTGFARSPRSSSSSSSAPRRSFGSKFGGNSGAPRKSFRDRSESFGESSSEGAPRRSFRDRSESSSEGAPRRSFRDRSESSSEGAPRRSFRDRSEFSSEGAPRRSFRDRDDASSEGAPRRSFRERNESRGGNEQTGQGRSFGGGDFGQQRPRGPRREFGEGRVSADFGNTRHERGDSAHGESFRSRSSFDRPYKSNRPEGSSRFGNSGRFGGSGEKSSFSRTFKSKKQISES